MASLVSLAIRLCEFILYFSTAPSHRLNFDGFISLIVPAKNFISTIVNFCWNSNWWYAHFEFNSKTIQMARYLPFCTYVIVPLFSSLLHDGNIFKPFPMIPTGFMSWLTDSDWQPLSKYKELTCSSSRGRNFDIFRHRGINIPLKNPPGRRNFYASSEYDTEIIKNSIQHEITSEILEDSAWWETRI